MNRPLTDRQRIYQLEAHVAELEEELAAWRGNAAAETRDELHQGQMQRLRLHLSRHRLNNPGGAARALMFLASRPERCVSRARLAAAIAHSEDVGLKVADVAVSYARKFARMMAFRGSITTVWGEGYIMSADLAEDVLAFAGAAP